MGRVLYTLRSSNVLDILYIYLKPICYFALLSYRYSSWNLRICWLIRMVISKLLPCALLQSVNFGSVYVSQAQCPGISPCDDTKQRIYGPGDVAMSFTVVSRVCQYRHVHCLRDVHVLIVRERCRGLRVVAWRVSAALAERCPLGSRL